MTNCKNAMIFRQETIDRAFDIEEIYRGVNLFSIITESQTVPTSTPKVANKITTQIKDFAESVNTLRQVSVRVPSNFCKFGGTLIFA